MIKSENWKLYSTVFICGAVVMIFELLASRVLGPYLGTSFYTWTSIIGVIMASLSAGYAFGGRWADKKADLEQLSVIVSLSALSLCLTVLLQPFILNLISTLKLGIEIRSVIAATILFALPSFCLAMITPFSVKIQLSGLKHSASTVGSLYALSTLGSIVGTFAAGFFLIPYFGTTLLENILIITLLFISILLAIKQHRLLKILLVLAVLLLIYFNGTKVSAMSKADPLIIDTKYNTNWLYHYQDPGSGRKILGFANEPFGQQSAMYLDNPTELVFAYTKFYRLAEYFAPNFQKTLMIGGCAYSFPKFFLANYPKALIDVVEIDPGVTDIAKKYFQLKDDPRLQIFHEDGRTYLNENTEKYDVIYGDAFNSASSVPFQLTTKEALSKMKDSLHENGIAIINLIGALEGDGADFIRAEYSTFNEVFDHVYLFKVKKYLADNSNQNFILVAIKGAVKPVNATNTKQLSDPLLKDLLDQIIPEKNLIRLNAPEMVLTDNFAPVEYYKYKSQRQV